MTDEAGENPKPTPLTKAEKLEAKAAQLREREAARAAATPPAGGAPATKQMLPWLIAVVVLVLAVVGVSVYAVHESSQADHAQRSAHQAKQSAAADAHLAALRTSALRTATTVATSFGTYDYKTLDADFARTKAYLTPSFAADFAKLTQSLGSLITQAKGQTVATVQDVGIESINPSTAVVLVFLDQKVTSADSSTPRLDHNRLKLTLSLQKNGSWLVSKLELI